MTPPTSDGRAHDSLEESRPRLRLDVRVEATHHHNAAIPAHRQVLEALHSGDAQQRRRLAAGGGVLRLERVCCHLDQLGERKQSGAAEKHAGPVSRKVLSREQGERAEKGMGKDSSTGAGRVPSAVMHAL